MSAKLNEYLREVVGFFSLLHGKCEWKILADKILEEYLQMSSSMLWAYFSVYFRRTRLENLNVSLTYFYCQKTKCTLTLFRFTLNLLCLYLNAVHLPYCCTFTLLLYFYLVGVLLPCWCTFTLLVYFYLVGVLLPCCCTFTLLMYFYLVGVLFFSCTPCH
jgi:hypothetical protein